MKRKLDSGKARWDLLPLDVIREVVFVIMHGNRKYDEDSWKNGRDRKGLYFSASLRHLEAHQSGELFDPESGLHHLAHAITNLVFLLWFALHENHD